MAPLKTAPVTKFASTINRLNIFSVTTSLTFVLNYGCRKQTDTVVTVLAPHEITDRQTNKRRLKNRTPAIFAATGRNLTIDLHSAHWRSETDWNIAILISEVQSAIISVHRV